MKHVVFDKSMCNAIWGRFYQQAAETSNGCWYQKKVTQPQDTAEGKRNNEDWKKEERNREGHLYSV